jgi:hypothetical protein
MKPKLDANFGDLLASFAALDVKYLLMLRRSKGPSNNGPNEYKQISGDWVTDH